MTTYPYVSTERLGRGGMGEVFLAVQRGATGFERVCVLKRLQRKQARDLNKRARFKEEARIGQDLRHDNIVEVLDFTKLNGEAALVMEHVLSVDLSLLLDLCRETGRPLPAAAASYVAAEVARGLHFAHVLADPVNGARYGIVHRDVSPANILVGSEGEVKLTDFGIALVERRQRPGGTGGIVGKLCYMSPEQVMDQPLDGRADVFGLALVLFEALTLERGYAQEGEVELMMAVREAKLEAHFAKIASQFDEELAAILARALDPVADERYADAATFERALRGYLAERHPTFTRESLKALVHELGGARLRKAREGIQEAMRKAAHVTAEKERAAFLESKPRRSAGKSRGKTVARRAPPPRSSLLGTWIAASVAIVVALGATRLGDGRVAARIAKPAREIVSKVGHQRGTGYRRAAAVAENGRKDLLRIRRAVRAELAEHD